MGTSLVWPWENSQYLLSSPKPLWYGMYWAPVVSSCVGWCKHCRSTSLVPDSWISPFSTHTHTASYSCVRGQRVPGSGRVHGQDMQLASIHMTSVYIMRSSYYVVRVSIHGNNVYCWEDKLVIHPGEWELYKKKVKTVIVVRYLGYSYRIYRYICNIIF